MAEIKSPKGLTIRRALTQKKRETFFLNLIQLAETEEDYEQLEKLLNNSDKTVNTYLVNEALIIVSKLGNIKSVNFLIENGADVNTQNEKGITALMLASRFGHIETVKFLIEKGANVNIRDIHDMSAFLYARDNNNEDIQMLLLKKGASARPINKSERAEWAAGRTEAHAANKAEQQRRLALLATKPKGARPTSPKPTGGARTRRRSRKSKGTRRR